MQPLVPNAIELIEQRLAEIQEEREKILNFLSGGKPRPKPRAKAKRRPWGERPAEFLDAVKASPGSSAADIGRAINASTNHAYGIGTRLLGEHKVKKVGRGYEVVT